MGLLFSTLHTEGFHEMTPIEMISAGLAILSLLFGGSLLTRHQKQSNEMAVAKYRLDVAEQALKEMHEKVNLLETNSAEVNTKVGQYAEHIKKLDLIPELQAQLKATQELVEGIRSLIESVVSVTLKKSPRKRSNKLVAA